CGPAKVYTVSQNYGARVCWGRWGRVSLGGGVVEQAGQPYAIIPQASRNEVQFAVIIIIPPRHLTGELASPSKIDPVECAISVVPISQKEGRPNISRSFEKEVKESIVVVVTPCRPTIVPADKVA